MDHSKKNLLTLLCLFVMTGLLVVTSQAIGSGGDEDGGTITFTTPVKGVIFEHGIHTEAGLDCESCHDDIFVMEAGAAAINGDFTMASFAEGNYCGACHDGDTAFNANSQCDACHHAPTEAIIFTKPVKAVVFEHTNHIGQGLECDSCHGDGLFKMETGAAEAQPEAFTMQALYDGQYCGACHDGDTAFASNTRCTICHIGVKGYNQMFGAPPKPSGH
jgi:c(7)-type cytochrome triheme protein